MLLLGSIALLLPVWTLMVCGGVYLTVRAVITRKIRHWLVRKSPDFLAKILSCEWCSSPYIGVLSYLWLLPTIVIQLEYSLITLLLLLSFVPVAALASIGLIEWLYKKSPKTGAELIVNKAEEILMTGIRGDHE